MSLDLSQNRMEGLSGLSLIPPHQRNFLNKMMKPSEPTFASAFTASGFGLHNFMQANATLGSLGAASNFNLPYSRSYRPTGNRMSPKSPNRDGGSESESKGKKVEIGNENVIFIQKYAAKQRNKNILRTFRPSTYAIFNAN